MALATLILLATQRLVFAHCKAPSVLIKLAKSAAVAIAKAGVTSARL